MNSDTQVHLQALEAQLEDGQTCLAKVKEEAAAAQRRVSQMERRIEMMRKQIESVRTAAANSLTTGGVIVSDHAVVRYLERAHGLSIDGVREEMLDPKTRASIAFLGGVKGKINANGLTYIVENNTVITVVPTP